MGNILLILFTVVWKGVEESDKEICLVKSVTASILKFVKHQELTKVNSIVSRLFSHHLERIGGL